MNSRLIQVEMLSAGDREAMYHLLSKHFQGVTWDGFLTDLYRKNWVLCLEEADTHILKGFTTLRWQPMLVEGNSSNVLYSGDTIVDPSAWQSALLPRAWIAAVYWLQHYSPIAQPQQRLYWLLICSGFRTYRFLPTFCREYYPRYDQPTPAVTAQLMAQLAQSYYLEEYQSTTGIVHLTHPQILRDNLIGIPKGRQANPHIQFFTDQNPGYRQGDELVCFTEFCDTNLTRAGHRIWQSAQSLKFQVAHI
jgi:hypothetical protein